MASYRSASAPVHSDPWLCAMLHACLIVESAKCLSKEAEIGFLLQCVSTCSQETSWDRP
jgi:hypothetical protein